MGYKVAVLRELSDGRPETAHACLPTHTYIGWARSVNLLVASGLAHAPEAEWFVTGGDDYFPDPNKRAEDIAQECSAYFARLHAGPEAAAGVDLSAKSLAAACDGLLKRTFGEMQPTGDRGRAQRHRHHRPHRRIAVDGLRVLPSHVPRLRPDVQR